MGDADYILAFQKIVMPIAMEFAPELVFSQSRDQHESVAVLANLARSPSLCWVRRRGRR